MALECSLQLAGIPVPDFHSGACASRCEHGIGQVKTNSIDLVSMPTQCVFGVTSGQPVLVGTLRATS
jgi:hypothetical protein